MAIKDSKKLKTFLITYGILLIMVGIWIILNTLSQWDYLGVLQYSWHPGYIIGGGIGVLITGLSALLASRDPIKYIMIINLIIAISILMIIFNSVKYHMAVIFDSSFSDPGGILDFFLLLPSYLVLPANILLIIFIIILIALRPKKAYKERRAMVAKEPNTTLKVFLFICGIYIITKGALIIFTARINWRHFKELQYPWHPGYVIGAGIGVLIIGLSVLLASREPAKHIMVIDLIIIISILFIIFYFIVFFSYIYSEIGFDNFFKDLIKAIKGNSNEFEGFILALICLLALNISPIVILIISIALRLKQGRLRKQLSN
jgi:hypothetical protein